MCLFRRPVLRWLPHMRFILTPAVAVLFVMMAYSGGALPDIDPSASDDPEIDWASLAVPQERFADIQPVAPGPYTGEGADSVPPGWSKWQDDVHQQCGDMTLVFLNPDLQEDSSGMVHAQGRFFIQFQAVGETADEITRFSFSFGKTTREVNSNEELNCNDSLPETAAGRGTAGAYLLFYRSDFDPSTGFFVPIETQNVPDGEYAAAVHAYTGNDMIGYTEVARAWAMATVKNCNGSSIPNSCPDDEQADIIANDDTMPWPWVLPGDGEQIHGVDGLTIEVLEPIAGDPSPSAFGEDLARARSEAAIEKGVIRAWHNNVEVELEPWIPPARDRDLVPLNDDQDCPANVRSGCEKVIYSQGWKWEGPIECDDLIRVYVKDLNGNEVTKQIHNCRTFGGASTDLEALVDWGVIGSDFKTLDAGDGHRFEMRLENRGGGDAHINLMLDYNETWIDGFWENVADEHEHSEGHDDYGETHVEIKPGQVTTLDIVVKTDKETPKGVYPLKASLEYPRGGVMETMSRSLTLTVDSQVEEATNETEEEEPELEDSPFLGTALILTLVGISAIALRRRHG